MGTAIVESLPVRERYALRGYRGHEEQEQVEETVVEFGRWKIAVRAYDNAVRRAALPGRRSGDRCLKGQSK